MKGHSIMMVPVARNHDKVQWHLIATAKPSTRISYRAVHETCPIRVSTEEFGLHDLRHARAFVGWCSIAECLLGSESAKYEAIDSSTSSRVPRWPRVANATVGFSHWGTVQLQTVVSELWEKLEHLMDQSLEREKDANIMPRFTSRGIIMGCECNPQTTFTPVSEVPLH